jgi:hypothetical protein
LPPIKSQYHLFFAPPRIVRCTVKLVVVKVTTSYCSKVTSYCSSKNISGFKQAILSVHKYLIKKHMASFLSPPSLVSGLSSPFEAVSPHPLTSTPPPFCLLSLLPSRSFVSFQGITQMATTQEEEEQEEEEALLSFHACSVFDIYGATAEWVNALRLRRRREEPRRQLHSSLTGAAPSQPSFQPYISAKHFFPSAQTLFEIVLQSKPWQSDPYAT